MDLNADVGEGVGDDAAMLAIVTSANVACGFHAGDAETMRRVCAAAARSGVGVGAHVSYRDRDGFGRRPLDVAFEALRDDVAEQVAALAAVARAEGATLTHVKPHGALYHRAATDDEQAAAVVAGVLSAGGAAAGGAGGAAAGDASAGGEPAMFGLPGSALLRMAAEAGLATVPEGFADRGYEADGSLRPRGEAGAVIEDADVVAARAVALARDGEVVAHDGTTVALTVRTLCVHGDTPGAVALAAAVRAALESASVPVARWRA